MELAFGHVGRGWINVYGVEQVAYFDDFILISFWRSYARLSILRRSTYRWFAWDFDRSFVLLRVHRVDHTFGREALAISTLHSCIGIALRSYGSLLACQPDRVLCPPAHLAMLILFEHHIDIPVRSWRSRCRSWLYWEAQFLRGYFRLTMLLRENLLVCI